MIAEAMLPHNAEAEEAVIGALLIQTEAIGQIAHFLKPSDFFRERNGVIYAARLDLHERREPGDFVTLCDELTKRGQLEQIGGPAYLASLINATPTAVHVEHYAHIVERCSLLRQIVEAGGRIARLGFDGDDGALESAQQVLYDISSRRASGATVPLKQALSTYFDKIDYLHEHKGEIVGVPSGFHDLDALTNGFQASDLVIIAGRPSVGKTALAASIIRNAAKAGAPVAMFSLEMSSEQLTQRLLSMESGVDSQRLRTGYMDEFEWRRISEAFGVLSELPIWIDDTPAITPMELLTKARRLQSEHGIRLLVVDYLQLMATGGRGRENRVQEVSELSRRLKGLARDLEIPVLALSQLSRGIEYRQDHRPQLSDLRDSGAIEQDADLVCFVHREDLYNPNTERKNVADLIIAKHRNGATGQVSLRFFPTQTRFADLEMYREEGRG